MLRSHFRRLLLLVLPFVFIGCLAFSTVPAHATDYVWTGAGDASSWHDAANWEPSAIPGAGDTVELTAAVNLATPVSLKSITINGGTLAGAELTLTGNSTWSVGQVFSPLHLQTGAGITIDTNSGAGLNGPLTNDGTVTLIGSGSLSIEGLGNIDNHAAGTINFTGDGSASGGGSIENAGLMTKTSGGTSIVAVPVNNTGTVNGQTGLLELQGCKGNGTFTAGAGAALALTLNSNLSSGVRFGGQGTVALTDATVNGAATATSNAVSIAGNFVANTVAWSGNLAWTSGTVTGDLTLAAGSICSIDSQGLGTALNGTFTNNGAVQISNFDLSIAGNGSFFNSNGATVSLRGDAGISPEGNPGSFDNKGILSKADGTGTSTIGIPITSTGTVTVVAGNLVVSGGSGGGNYTAATGASLTIQNYTFAAGSTLTGSVSLQDTTFSGAVTANGNGVNIVGNITANNVTWNGNLTWSVGTLFGVLTVPTTSTLTIIDSGIQIGLSGTLNNNGTIKATGNNQLAFDFNAVLNNNLGATIEITQNFGFSGSGGSISNAGTLRKTGGTGAAAIDPTFTSTGSITVTGGSFSCSSPASVTGTLTSGPGASVAMLRSIVGSAGLDVTSGSTISFGGLTSNGRLALAAGNYDFESVDGAGPIEAASGANLQFNGGPFSATLSLSGATVSGSLNLEGGTLTGNGQINGDLTNNGKVEVGAVGTTAILQITGTYLQGSFGALYMEIHGAVPGNSQDQVVVGGSVQIDGTLDITLSDYTPQVFDAFTIIKGDSMSGVFSNITGLAGTQGQALVPSYGAKSVNIDVAIDTNNPGANVTAPQPGSAINFLPANIAGAAFDDSTGVAKVDLTLRRLNPAAYWNSATAAWVTVANGASPPLIPVMVTLGNSHWQSSGALPSGSNLTDGAYRITATPIDRAQNVGATTTADFTVDNSFPTIAITTPVNNAVVTSLSPVVGTIGDGALGSGVERVQLRIKRNDNRWWNADGLSWDQANTEEEAPIFDAEINEGGTGWQRANPGLPSGLDLVAGSYRLFAYATDRAGNATAADAVTVSITARGSLSLTLDNNAFTKSAGPNATQATISLSAPQSGATLVNLSTTNINLISLPASITIPAGDTVSAPFTIGIVQDFTVNGTHTEYITAGAQFFTTDQKQIVILDDNTAGINVSPTDGLVTNQAGKTALFSVVLTSRPSSAVTLGLSSSDPGQVQISPTELVFSGADWNVPQTVLLTGRNNGVDSDQPYTIITAPADSTDPNYAGKNAPDVTVLNERFIPLPAITRFSPGGGGPGKQVVITGTDFNGATNVTIGGATCGTLGNGFTVDSATQITAVVPAGATPGPGVITITTRGGTGSSNPQKFIVAPINDDFSNATGSKLVGDSGNLTATNNGATKETGEYSHGANSGGASVWYSWTPATGGTATISTQGSSFDTLLAVYEQTGGTFNSLKLLAQNDDAFADNSSKVTFPAGAGKTYFIAIDGSGGKTGTFKLIWTASETALSPTIHWNVARSDFWNVAGNWIDNTGKTRTPRDGDIVALDKTGAFVVTLNAPIPPNLGGLVITGGQTLLIQSNTQLVLSGPGNVAAGSFLNLQGGILTNNSTLTIDGAFDWSGGTLNGNGNTRVNTAGRFNISGAAAKALSAQHVENLGAATWTGNGDIKAGSGATLVNSGAFTVQTDASVVWDNIGERATVTNVSGGTVRKNLAAAGIMNRLGTRAGSGTTAFTDVAFSNLQGQVTTESGSISLQGGGISYGNFHTADTTRIEFSRDYRLDKQNTTFTSAGTGKTAVLGGSFSIDDPDAPVNVSVGNFDLGSSSSTKIVAGHGASLNVNGVFNGQNGKLEFSQQGAEPVVRTSSSGVLTGSSELQVSVDNTGLINPSSPLAAGASPRATTAGGLITIAGDLTQRSAGRINIQIGGVLDTSTTPARYLYGRVSVGRTVNLNTSTLSASFLNGFVPTTGQQFEIITARDITGAFGNVTSGVMDAGNGIKFNVTIVPFTINAVTGKKCVLTAQVNGPVIGGFSPASGPVGQSVVITGKNLASSLSVKPVVKFGASAVPAADITISSLDQLTVKVPVGAATGRITVTVGTNSAVSATEFTVQQPAVVQFGAATYTAGEADASKAINVTRGGDLSGSVTINYAVTGGTAQSGIDYTLAAGSLAFAPNETSKSIVVTLTNDALHEDAETVNLTLTLPAGSPAQLGAQKAAVLTITDNDPLPALITLDPLSGIGGATVTITGTNLTGATALKFGSTSTVIGSNTATQIKTTVPAGIAAGATTVTVTTPAGTSNGLAFTVNPTNTAGALQFSGSNYNVNENAGTVTVSVIRTGGSSGAATVIYGTTDGTAKQPGDYSARSGTLNWSAGDSAAKTFTIPIINDTAAEAGETMTVTLSKPTGAILGSQKSAVITIIDNDSTVLAPSITTLTPATGPVGSAVTITGSNFSAATSVKFGTVAATIKTNTATQITTNVPAGLATGAVNVTVTTAGGTSAAKSFTVTAPAPTIASFTPATGKVGSNVTITGANFTGAISVKFKGVVATFTVLSATQIRATVPAGATTGTITVITPGGTATSATSFTVPQPPAITTFSPISGIWGTEVTISGKNFTGATIVKFNNKATATLTVVSDTQIKATVPIGMVTGPIAITTGAGVAPDTGKFVVLAPPSITTFSPASGKAGATITISGSNFTGLRELKFFNNKQPAIVSITDTQIVAKVPVGATTGPIFIRTGIGQMSTKGSFFVLPGTPPRESSVKLSSGAASVTTGSITLTFNAALDADSALDAARYAVAVNGMSIEITSVRYEPATRLVILTVDEGQLHAGDAVVVAWTAINDAAGGELTGQAPLTCK